MYSAWRSCIEKIGHECYNVITLESFRKQLKSLKSFQEELFQYFTPPSMNGQGSQPIPHPIGAESESGIRSFCSYTPKILNKLRKTLKNR